MTVWTVQDWLLIIAAVAAGIVLVVKEIGQWWGRHDAKQLLHAVNTNTRITEKIEEQTNGGFDHMREKLSEADDTIGDMRNQIIVLRAEIVQLHAHVQKGITSP
jgi:hypothetical protein